MKYYCTGEVLENGYLKCVVPEMNDVDWLRTATPDYSYESYLKSLPIAALVKDAKTGWLEGYEERYEALEFPKQERWAKISKAQYDRIVPSYRRIVLVKKPEQEIPSEGIIEAYGLQTRYWGYKEQYGFGCEECCNGDRCDETCTAKYLRKHCPHCKGKGWIPKNAATNIRSKPAKKPEEKSEAETMCDKILPMREFYPSNIGRGIAEAKREGFIIGFKTASSVEDRPNDMTVEEFYSGFNLDFLTPEERRTIYTATELYAKGKMRQNT